MLAGKVALVTGASRGIGRATAIQLAEENARVAINYNSSREPALELERNIRERDGEAWTFQADVSKQQDLSRMLEEVTTQLGEVDILVNNAGFVRDRVLLRMSTDDWNAVWATDFTGAAALARAVLPSMKRRGWGRVINIASVVGIAGNAGQANYAAAKGAIIGFTQDLAPVVARDGVTVNCVAPGYIDTDATAGMEEQYKERWLRQIPVGRWGRAEEIASVIRFLASPEASYITGQCIVVDGGLLISRR